MFKTKTIQAQISDMLLKLQLHVTDSRAATHTTQQPHLTNMSNTSQGGALIRVTASHASPLRAAADMNVMSGCHTLLADLIIQAD